MADKEDLEGIIEAVAAQACSRVTRRTISQLRKIHKARLSADDSGLKNTWDEICVQVQGEESTFWDSYLDIIGQCLRQELGRLPKHELQSLWLQTQNGEDWLCSEYEQDSGPVPYCEDDVVEHVVMEHILTAASDYRNARIEKYLYGDPF